MFPKWSKIGAKPMVSIVKTYRSIKIDTITIIGEDYTYTYIQIRIKRKFNLIFSNEYTCVCTRV